MQTGLIYEDLTRPTANQSRYRYDEALEIADRV